MTSEMSISASDWMKGIGLSIAASIIGGASKLAIRKSWLMVEHLPEPNSTSLLPLLGFPSTCKNGIYHDNNSINGIKSNAETAQGKTNFTLCEPAHVSENNDAINPGSKLDGNIELSQFQQQGECSNLSRGIKGDSSISFHNMDLFDPTDNSRLQLADTNIQIQRRSLILRFSGMFGMTVLNPACCVWAMVYASPSVLAPFSGLTLVWIVMFSEYLINEQPLPRQILAAALIILGEVITAIMGDHTNDSDVTIEQVAKSYQDRNFIGFFVGLSLWLVLLFFLVQYSSSPAYRRFAWGVSGGSITGLQNFLKDGLTTLSVTPSGQPYPYFLYVFLVGGIFSSLSGLLLLTACMKRYDATYSSSMFVGSFVISASIMSAIHYHTFENLETVWNFVFYPLGLLILLSGVIILAFTPNQSSQEMERNQALESSKSLSDRIVTLSFREQHEMI